MNITADARPFALLRLGAAGRNFKGREWAFPGGRVRWVRWIDHERLPTMHRSDDPNAPHRPYPDEWSEEWLDESPRAGRFVLAIEGGLSYDDARRTALRAADGLAGLHALLNFPFNMRYPVAELPAEWVLAGEVIVQEFEAWSEEWVPLEDRLATRELSYF
jgi:hypothetical protein